MLLSGGTRERDQRGPPAGGGKVLRCGQCSSVSTVQLKVVMSMKKRSVTF